jgi:hypothetical protein
MKKLVILNIVLTLCLVAVCIYYVLTVTRTPVLTISPDGRIEQCTLYPLCIKKTKLPIFLHARSVCIEELCAGGFYTDWVSCEAVAQYGQCVD